MSSEPEHPPDTETGSYHDAERHYWNRQFIVQWAMVFITAFTFGAAAVYAYWAWQQVNVLSKTLNITERPWVAADITIVKPLTFDPSGGATIGLSIKMTNLGGSLATHVAAAVELMPFNAGSIWTLPNEQQQLCNKFAKHIGEFSGYFLFPHRDATRYEYIVIRKPEISKDLNYLASKMIALSIVGCVDYRSVLSIEHHHTQFLYSLSVPGYMTTFVGAHSLIMPTGTHPELILIPDPVLGFDAN